MSTDDDDFWFAKRQFIANASRSKPKPKSRKDKAREIPPRRRSHFPTKPDKRTLIKDEMLRDLRVRPIELQARFLEMGINEELRRIEYVRSELRGTIRLLQRRGLCLDIKL